MWEQLKATASTPSTVIYPTQPRAAKRQREEEGEGSWAAADSDSMAD